MLIDFSSVYQPHKRQREAHLNPARFIFYGGAVGGGKTYFGCAEMIQLCLDFPGIHVLVARYEASSYFSTTHITLMRLLPRDLIKVHRKTVPYHITLINDSVIFYGGLKTTQQDDPLSRLKSMELGGFFIDEATDLPKEIFLWLQSRLRMFVTKKGVKVPPERMRGILTGNPEKCWLYNDVVLPCLTGNPPPDFAFIQALPSDNPYLPDDYVERLKKNFPPEWVRRYLEGEWSFQEDKYAVIPFIAAKAACERTLQPSEPIILGIDVARYGGDSTVLALRRGPVVRIIDAFKFTDLVTASSRIAEKIDEVEFELGKKPLVVIDTVGLGAGVYDNLRARGYSVQEAIAGSRPFDTERFTNAVSEWWWNVRRAAEDGLLDIDPEDEELFSQLTSRRYEISAEKKIALEPKAKHLSRGLKSPDRADAVALTFSREVSGPSIAIRIPPPVTLEKPENLSYNEIIQKRIADNRFWENIGIWRL